MTFQALELSLRARRIFAQNAPGVGMPDFEITEHDAQRWIAEHDGDIDEAANHVALMVAVAYTQLIGSDLSAMLGPTGLDELVQQLLREPDDD